MGTFKLSDLSDFKKYEKIGTTRKNRKNKARRRERRREWIESHPRPETIKNDHKKPDEHKEVIPVNVNDVIRAASNARKAKK